MFTEIDELAIAEADRAGIQSPSLISDEPPQDPREMWLAFQIQEARIRRLEQRMEFISMTYFRGAFDATEAEVHARHANTHKMRRERQDEARRHDEARQAERRPLPQPREERQANRLDERGQQRSRDLQRRLAEARGGEDRPDPRQDRGNGDRD